MPLGLYLSRCRGRTSDVLDLDALAARFAGDAAVVRVVDDFFSEDFAPSVAEDVSAEGLDAVVLAGNSPEHFVRALSAPFTVERIVEAGVNPNRIAHANLLEQVALPHAGDPNGAAVKAEAVLAEAVLRARRASLVVPTVTPTRDAVLVLGASPAGVVAAQRLLRLGHPVVVASRGDHAPALAGVPAMQATASYVAAHPAAVFVDGAAIADGDGWAGDFSVTLATPGGPRTFEVGGIVLAEADAETWTAELRKLFPLDVDGEGHAKALAVAMHPAEAGEPGIVLVPPHDPEDPRAVVAAADAAAMALTLELSGEHVKRYHHTSVVDPDLCGGCASCVKTCAFGACRIDAETGVSYVDPRRCRGCGKCVVSCPVGARDIVDAPHQHLVDTIRRFAESPVSGHRVLGFLCGGCGYPAADRAGEAARDGGGTYPASFLPLRINCGGRLDALYVLEAFRAGFDGVAVFRCREGRCRNLIGNLDMDRRINLLRTVLRSRNLDDSRLRLIDITSEEGETFTAEVNAFFGDLGSLVNGKGGVL
jgi:heterodisulfide reductase subunit A-like polyferredoxin/coenzyme F420-reducing hydrogenase delta subunit